jgi:hypothetical protein
MVERAVMAPDISKVDTNRHLNQGLPAWNFRNMVVLASSWETVSPIRKTCSSHL